MQENLNGGTITYYLNADDSDLQAALGNVPKEMDKAAQSASGFKDAATRSFSSAADAALSFASNVVKAVGDALDAVNSIGSSITSTFEKISGITLPTADMGYASEALGIGADMAAMIEGASKGMTLMTKDSKRTEAIMNTVVEDATKTTFNVANLLGYTQQIGAAAHGDYEAAERAALGFGGAMVAAGNGLRDMGLVVRNVQQGMARGYNSIDLRQFKTYIPQFTQIMEQAGLTDEKIIEMGADGAKVVNDTIAAWVEANNIWEEYEYTYTNLKESLKEALQTTALAAYQDSGLMESIRQAMIVMKQNLPILQNGLTKIAKTIADVIDGIDVKSYMQGVANGLEKIGDLLSKAAKVVMNIIKLVGGGDVSKGLERIIPAVTTLTIVVGGLTKFGQVAGSIGNIFNIGKKTTESVSSFGNLLGKVAGTKGVNGGKLGSLTQLAISVAAFAGAIWLINKALPDSNAGVLLAKLGIVASAMVVFELIGRLATKIKLRAAQMKNLALLAADVALFAGAIWVVDKAIPENIGMISAKLGILAGVVAAFGALAGVAGIEPIANALKKGLIIMAAIAADLVICALALKLAYDVLPGSSEFGEMQAKIGGLALVIVEIGVLAAAIGLLMDIGGAVFVVAGLATMIGIAGSLALVGLGLRSAYESLPGSSEFVEMQAKIGGLSLVTAEIGALAVAMGAAQIFSFGMLTVGLLTLVEIAGALAASAIGIRTAADNMPDDMENVGKRIKAGIEFLKQIKDDYAGEGGLFAAIGNFFFNNDSLRPLDTFAEISKKLAVMSVNLATTVETLPSDTVLKRTTTALGNAIKFISQLKEQFGGDGGLFPTLGSFFYNNEGTSQFDTFNTITEKLKTLATNLEELSAVSTGKLSRVVNGPLFPTLETVMNTLKEKFANKEGGFFHDFGHFFYNEDSTTALDQSVKIAETLGKLVDNLAKIQDVKTGKLEVAIQVTIPKLKEVVNKLHDEFTGGGGFLASIGAFFSGSESTDALNKSTEIAETLGKLVENLSKIQDLDTQKLAVLAGDDQDKNPIIKLKGVVTKIKSTFVDDADSITNKLKEYDTSGLEKANTVADNIKQIADKMSGVGDIKIDVPKIETFISNMRTIVGKIDEQFGGESNLIHLDEDTASSIQNVASVASNLSQMSQDVNAIQPVNFEDVSTKLDNIRKIVVKILNMFTPGAEDGSVDLTAFSSDEISSSVGQVKSTLDNMKLVAETANALPAVKDGLIGEGGIIGKIKAIIKEVAYTLDNTGEDAIDLTSLATTNQLLPEAVGVIDTLKTIANNTTDFPDAEKGSANLKTFVANFVAALKSLTTEFDVNGFYTDMKDVGSKAMDNIYQGFNNEFRAISQQNITSFTEFFLNCIESDKNAYEKGGENISDWLVKSFVNHTKNNGNAWQAVRDMIDNATNQDLRWVAEQNGTYVGDSLATGIKRGLENAWWSVWSAAKNLANAAKEGIKVTLQIHSPSKVLYQYGTYAGEGFTKGIRSTTGNVADASRSLSQAVINGISYKAFKDIGADAAQGLADGLTSLTEEVAKSARSLADTINTELDTVNPVSYVGSPANVSGVTENNNRTTNVTMNNNIYNELDLSSAMSSLKWEMAKG